MKKILFLILILTLVFAFGLSVALADNGAAPGEALQFFTWAELATYAGALAATMFITQLLKGVGFIDRIPTRLFSFIVALIVLVVSNIFIGGFTAQTALLCIVNAAVISLSGNGVYDGFTDATTRAKKETFYD